MHQNLWKNYFNEFIYLLVEVAAKSKFGLLHCGHTEKI